jgi:hypothetical protein
MSYKSEENHTEINKNEIKIGKDAIENFDINESDLIYPIR